MTLEHPNPVGVLWGAAEIGRAIGKSKRQAFHLLESGRLQGAKKVGGRWVITLRALMVNFEEGGGDRPEMDRLSPENSKALLPKCEERPSGVG